MRQSVYSLWLGTVEGGGLALLLNPQKVIVLSHVRVMETIAKKDSQQNPIQRGTHALHPSLSLPDYRGKHRAQNAQTTTRPAVDILHSVGHSSKKRKMSGIPIKCMAESGVD